MSNIDDAINNKEVYINYESSLIDYVILTKPRVMLLAIFTAICGMLVAPGKINSFLAVVDVLCIALSAGASGVINMWYERDIDVLMKRTMNRPLPQNRIHPDEAFSFGLILALFSLTIIAFSASYLSALLLFLAMFMYMFVYTAVLKKNTDQNIVIGGISGALPPMIGWSCVTGGISLDAIILFLIIFFWTPAHFWALAILKIDEYRAASIPMMPLTKGIRYTKVMILLYTFLTVFITILLFCLSNYTYFYLLASSMLTLLFFYIALKLYFSRNDEPALLTDLGMTKYNSIEYVMFWYSIIYLFLIFVIIVVDKLYF